MNASDKKLPALLDILIKLPISILQKLKVLPLFIINKSLNEICRYQIHCQIRIIHNNKDKSSYICHNLLSSGNGNRKVTPVLGDDFIILGATHHHPPTK